MSQSQVIVAISDAWLLDSSLPAVRRRGVIYGPADEALATQEVAVVRHKTSEHEPATTLLPVLRLPQRQISREHMPASRQSDLADDDLPTVVIPTLSLMHDDMVTAIMPVTHARSSATPTTPRPEPCHYCYQCGAVLPPWRESCYAHEAGHGRGLPPPPTLQALPESAVDLRPTLPLPAIRRQRAD